MFQLNVAQRSHGHNFVSAAAAKRTSCHITKESEHLTVAAFWSERVENLRSEKQSSAAEA